MIRLTLLLALAFSIALPVHAADKFVGLKMELNNPKNKPAKVTAPDHPILRQRREGLAFQARKFREKRQVVIKCDR